MAVFMVLALWGAAAPMFSSPDEVMHMIRAEGAVRGAPGGAPLSTGARGYRSSDIYDSNPDCYKFRSEATADCLVISGHTGIVLNASSAATYPPTFHLLIGWPSLLTRGLKSLYLMRLANALVCALLLTVAVSNVRSLRERGPAMLGLSMAVSPMVLFVGGTVNPSGVAAAAGIATWTGALALSQSRTPRPVPLTMTAFGAPLCLLLLVRRDSLLWGGAVVLCAFVLFTRERMRSLLHVRATWFWGVACLVTALAHLFLWTGPTSEGFVKGAEGRSSSIAFGFGWISELLFQAVGTFGHLDTRLPSFVYIGWFALALSLMVGALAYAPPRVVASLVLSLGFLVAITTAINVVRFPYLQGRYLFPLLVGLPILAGYGLGQRTIGHRLPTRAVAVWFGIVFLLHQLAFGQHLRRYVVGSRGPLNFFMDGDWRPPTAPAWSLLLLYALSSAALMAVLASATRVPQQAATDVRPDG